MYYNDFLAKQLKDAEYSDDPAAMEQRIMRKRIRQAENGKILGRLLKELMNGDN
jgi:hypothetical protein